MAKTNKQRKQERKERIQMANVLKYIKCLAPEDTTTWYAKLEEIEKATSPEEKEEKTLHLQTWLALKYVEANRSLCESCSRKETCLRNKEKRKSCILYEWKGDDSNEEF